MSDNCTDVNQLLPNPAMLESDADENATVATMPK